MAFKAKKGPGRKGQGKREEKRTESQVGSNENEREARHRLVHPCQYSSVPLYNIV